MQKASAHGNFLFPCDYAPSSGDDRPQPVRSQEFLMGIPGISGLDQVKVDVAKLYLGLGLFIEWLHERGRAWVP